MNLTPAENMERIIQKLKENNQRIVFTNGCFDLLHPGHIRFLVRAKELGDYLIVGIISDKQIADFKGEDRPVQSEEERIITVGSLKMVDAVIMQKWYDPSDELSSLSMINILTKGDGAVRQFGTDDADPRTKATYEESNLYSDATLIVYSSKNQPKVNVQFKNMFPTSLSSLEYSQELTDVEYFKASATFRYLYYEFETSS